MSPFRALRIALVCLALGGCTTKADEGALRAACEAGSARACEAVALLALSVDSGMPDLAEVTKYAKRADELWSKACTAGDREACMKMTICSLHASTRLDTPALPPATDGGPTSLTLTVDIHADGALFANGQRVADYDALEALASATVREQPETRAVIRADPAVAHGRVIRALDALKHSGVSKIAFGIPADAGAP